MNYTVRVLRKAQQDIASCYAYLAERSRQGAANWFNRFVETRERLANELPNRPLATESRFVEYEIREVLFKTRRGKPYRILFTVVGNEVHVLRIRGPGRDELGEYELGVVPPTA